MRNGWKETDQRSIRLEEDEPETVQLYIQWLYYRVLPVACSLPGDEEYALLAKAFVLGDRLRDVDFANAVMDAMVEKCQTPASDGKIWYPEADVVKYVYDNTPDSSPVRRFFVDVISHNERGGWLGSKVDLPKDFLYDLSSALLTFELDRANQAGNPSTGGNLIRCGYHQHDMDTKVCPSQRYEELEIDLFKRPYVTVEEGLSQKRPRDPETPGIGRKRYLVSRRRMEREDAAARASAE
jgi:hypothetical protein